MSPADKSRYWIEKLAKRKSPEFPLATIAHYGPNDRSASKVVVSIFLKDDAEIDVLERWFSEADEDVRARPDINDQILQLLRQHGVKRVAMADRIIGCPHEEGKDYPEGATCPECPFWAGRDRWTGATIR